jgi:hypothetical protein
MRPFGWIIGRISEGSDFSGTPEYKTQGGWDWKASKAQEFDAGEVDAEVARLTEATDRICYRVVRLEPLPITVAPERDAPRNPFHR